MSIVSTLVVDAGALIKKIDLSHFSGNLVTVPQVLSEIRDKATRNYLNVLPFKLNLQVPAEEHVTAVKEFSGKTGDLSALSAADIQLISLARQLSVENGMNIRKEPKQEGSWKLDENYDDAQNFPGFFHPKGDGHDDSAISDNSTDNEGKRQEDNYTLPSNEKADESRDFSDEKSETDDSDNEGWVTPESLGLAKINLNSNAAEFDNSSTNISVATMTFDYAIQNVMLQLGLHLLSPLKMLIKEARSYALRCSACFKIVQKTEKVFCPKCGHRSLERVTVSTDIDGKKTYALLRRRPFSMKGTRFSLPRPKGGKYAHNPVLVDHQPGAQQRASKSALSKVDPLDIDFVALQSPFSLRDTTSRAAQLGFNSGRIGMKTYWERRNPNVVAKKKK